MPALMPKVSKLLCLRFTRELCRRNKSLGGLTMLELWLKSPTFYGETSVVTWKTVYSSYIIPLTLLTRLEVRLIITETGSTIDA